MARINFKNGDAIEDVPQEIVELLAKLISAPEGAVNWQTFTDENGKTFLIINLLEVNCIRG